MMGKKCIQLNLVAFSCFFFAFFSPIVNLQIHVANWPFCLGKLVPSVFCPVNHFTILALVCWRVTKFVSRKRWKVGTKCLLSGKWWIECYVSHNVLFLYRLSGCEIVFVTKGFYLVGFHFQVYQTDVNFSGTFSQKTVGQLYVED